MNKPDWKCGRCGKMFDTQELMELKMVPMVPTDKDPKKQHGFAPICNRCDYVFHKDKFRLVHNANVMNGYFQKFKVRVSTVFLELEHPGGFFYETMIFVDEGKIECFFQDRYKEIDEAVKGHIKVLLKLVQGNYEVVKGELIIK